jgi:SPX domain protein involved in polyphosphate accumulation
MTDATLHKAAEIQRQFLQGQVTHQTAQARLRWTGYRMNDAVLLAELQRQDQTERAAAEDAEARRRQQDAKVNAYLRKEHERTKASSSTHSEQGVLVHARY